MSSTPVTENQVYVGMNPAYDKIVDREKNLSCVGSMMNRVVKSLRIDLPENSDEGKVMKIAKLVAGFALVVIAFVSVIGIPFLFQALKEATEQRNRENSINVVADDRKVFAEQIHKAYVEGTKIGPEPLRTVKYSLSKEQFIDVLKASGLEEKDIPTNENDIEADALKALDADKSLLGCLGTGFLIIPSGFTVVVKAEDTRSYFNPTRIFWGAPTKTITPPAKVVDDRSAWNPTRLFY